MLGNDVHVYFCLELTLGLKNLPPKAFLFGALQVVAMGSPFVHRPIQPAAGASSAQRSCLLIHPRGAM